MTLSKVSRREFLAFTGKSGGGLLLGASSVSFPTSALAAAPFPIAPETPVQALAFNIFVQIAPDDHVYIVAHRSEMGQGSKTGLPQVVADELEADWEKVKVVQAQGDAAYGSQNTDGSRSMRDFYHKMREMGATAKWMLQQAAARRWKISADMCEIKNHQVLRTDTRETASFGQLAEAASQIALPDTRVLSFKQAKKFRYIGESVDIVDLDKIVSGGTVFGMDVTLKGMLYASIERSPYYGGTLKSFDAKTAKQVTGVVDVVTIDHRPLPAAFHPLPGVAVVATNTWAALKGRKQLKIEWNPSQYQSHNSHVYMEEIRQSLDVKKPEVVRKKGDVEKGFASAAAQVEATYTVPYLVHAPMEPMAATAITQKDKVEVWACTQTPQAAQKALIDRFGLKPEQVKVNVTLLGGGFGRKSKPDYVVEAAELSRAMNGKPVRMMWTREDEIRHAYYHAISAIKLKAGLNKQKHVTVWQGRVCYPSISSTWDTQKQYPSKSELELGFVNTPFDLKNEQIESAPIHGNTRIGWLRSVCNIQQGFAIGSFVDELAQKTGRDTVDMWMEMIGKDRKIDYQDHAYTLGNYGRSLEDFPYETERLKYVLKTVADKSGWRKKTPKNEGWGVSCHYSFLSYVAIATRVSLEGENLSIKEIHCAVDCGLAVNPDRVKSQMEGSVIFGLSLALMGEITFDHGQVEQSNFHDYPVLRFSQSPDITVHVLKNKDAPRGVGEPGVPPVAPSLTNAIVAAGGRRIRNLPINKLYRV